jgi:hypothetical protein
MRRKVADECPQSLHRKCRKAVGNIQWPVASGRWSVPEGEKVCCRYKVHGGGRIFRRDFVGGKWRRGNVVLSASSRQRENGRDFAERMGEDES